MRNEDTREPDSMREKVAKKTAWLSPAALILLAVALVISLLKHG